MNIAIIIQARMLSTRLPGKVLLTAANRPLLGIQLERLSYIHADQIIVATSTNAADDPIFEYVHSLGVPVFRGSEDDVLSRYYGAAQTTDADTIIRLTADCPLLPPSVCNQLIQAFIDKGLDYAHTGQTYAEGFDCEIFTRTALESAFHEATATVEREHVTVWIRNHPERFKQYVMENSRDDRRYRVTVDEPADYVVVKAIIEYLYEKGDTLMESDAVLSFLATHPEILAINSSIERNESFKKQIKETGYSIKDSEPTYSSD